MKFVVPVLLALGFIAPAVITFGFAEQEATSFASDWVYISGGLLFCGGLSLGWAFARAMGPLGFIVGLLMAGGGMGYLANRLKGTIDERVQRMEAYRLLSDAKPKMVEVCKGGPPVAEAGAYDPKVAGRHPTLVFELSADGSDYGGPREVPDTSSWSPRRLDAAELVGCFTWREQTVESCRYSGGTLTRIRETLDASLRELKTGRVLWSQSFEGGTPDACADVEKFYSGSTSMKRAGLRPQYSVVLDAMRPLVEPK